MANRDFAIVTDASCDLTPAFLERAGVELVTPVEGPDGEKDFAGPLESLYRELAERGYTRVVSVHSAACFSPALDAARLAADACDGVCEVEVVDSGSSSAATGMLIDRIARYRYFDVDFHDAVAGVRLLAGQVRLLVVPSAKARFDRRRRRSHHRAGLLGRATASLRVRISGERGLYLLSRGEITQLARATDLVELTSRLAHAMSAVSAGEGEVVYALVEVGDARALRAAEKPLDTNEFESRCLGTVRATPLTESVVGTGAVAVAFAPASAYYRSESALEGLGSGSED